MTDEKAREILKKHCAAYGDTKYEPARWVIEALQDAVSIDRTERGICMAGDVVLENETGRQFVYPANFGVYRHKEI